LADRLADRAAYAVGTDGVPGVDGMCACVGANVEVDLLRVLAQTDHLGAVADPGTRRDGARLQCMFDVVLRRDEQVREAAGQPRQVHVDAVEQAQPGDRRPGRHHLLGEAPHVEQFERAGVHTERSGEVRAGCAALQHRDVDAGSGEVAGEQQAGRSGPDDDDGRPDVVEVHVPSGQQVFANSC
jgi:hypothetical protein